VLPFVQAWFHHHGEYFKVGWDERGRTIRYPGLAKYKWLDSLVHNDPYADA
jgi:hypothetical protein